jgi:hypothetical protein
MNEMRDLTNRVPVSFKLRLSFVVGHKTGQAAGAVRSNS